jgi:catechol-2,3-dioxygenase
MTAMHLGHVAFRATDPQASARFLGEALGLRTTRADAREVMLSCNEKHHEVQFIKASEPGVDHLGIELEDDRELDQLHQRIVEWGAKVIDEEASEPGIAKAIRVLGPLGLVFEFYSAMEREPLSVERYLPRLARRLGHVSFAAPDCRELESFLTGVVGLRVSDTLGGRISWLRCDQEHHAVALVTADQSPSLHHYAFQLESWGAIERYADGLALQGHSFVWGPGRHGPGRNLYTYVADPDNAIVEAYADMLEVASEASYRPIDWSERGDAALNLWGPLPPGDWRDYGVPILGPGRTQSDGETIADLRSFSAR